VGTLWSSANASPEANKDCLETPRAHKITRAVRARGEAEANRLRNSSLTPQLLELKRLENDRARIEKWNGDVPRMVMGDKTGMMLQMPYDSSNTGTSNPRRK
jgi:hypothetical protein